MQVQWELSIFYVCPLISGKNGVGMHVLHGSEIMKKDNFWFWESVPPKFVILLEVY